VRAVVQRVAWARVRVDGAIQGEIARGLCVLLCAMQGDDASDCAFMARKLGSLRIFPDAQERMNLSINDVAGGVLLVSQFTLAADTTSGSRPSFSSAMPADAAPRCWSRSRRRCARRGFTWRRAASARRWSWSCSTTAR